MASPRQDIPGRPDSTGESAPAPVATTVASTQRTVVSGAPASDEFRQSARAQVQAALEKARNGSPAVANNLLCPVVFHSKRVQTDVRDAAEQDQCGYCNKVWAASFPKKAMHLLGNSSDGNSGAMYKGQHPSLLDAQRPQRLMQS